jgi:selenocysteine lyase/cysteine desulfurase
MAKLTKSQREILKRLADGETIALISGWHRYRGDIKRIGGNNISRLVRAGFIVWNHEQECIYISEPGLQALRESE